MTFTIETLTQAGTWVMVHPRTGRFETYPTLTAARYAATLAEMETGAPCRAREV